VGKYEHRRRKSCYMFSVSMRSLFVRSKARDKTCKICMTVCKQSVLRMLLFFLRHL